MNRVSGQPARVHSLRFVEAPDYENPLGSRGNNEYQVTRITDFFGARGTINNHTTVQVVDVDNEGANTPLLLNADRELTILEKHRFVSGPFEAIDADGDFVEISIVGGADANDFDFTEGYLSFKNAPDFERPQDCDGNNDYEITVRVSDGSLSREYALSVTVIDILERPFYTEAVGFIDPPDSTMSRRPRFEWAQQEIAKEYEIFIGHRGETEAVFRTRGLSETDFQLPDDLESGEYTAWLRVYHEDGRFSRWGRGHDFQVGGSPDVSVDQTSVTWEAIDGSDRYEVWADEIDNHGHRLARRAIWRTDVTDTSFSVPEEFAGKNLTWWVRAVDDHDGTVEYSAWSRAASVQRPEYLPEPENAVVDRQADESTNWQVVIPNVNEAYDYEIVVTEAGKNAALYRERRSGASGSIDLDFELDRDAHDVWIRARGTGVAKSRWVKLKVQIS